MKQIELTQGYYAIVDNADYDMLSAYSWRVSICKYGCYAVRTQRTDEAPVSERRNVYMHKMIMPECPADKIVHHRDENGLNNRRENLEIVNRFENWRYYAEAKRQEKVPF